SKTDHILSVISCRRCAASIENLLCGFLYSIINSFSCKRYLAEQKKLKIKNKTRAVLLQEIETKMNFPDTRNRSVFCFNQRNESGIYAHHWGGELFVRADGELTPLFTKEVRFYSWLESFIIMDTDRKIAIDFGARYIGPMSATMTIKRFVTIDGKRYDINSHVVRLNSAGDLIGEFNIPEGYYIIQNGIAGEDIFCRTHNNEGANAIMRLRSGKVIWEKTVLTCYFYIEPILHQGYIYFSDRREDGGTLCKMDLDGNIVASLHLDCIRDESKLFFGEDSIYYMGDVIREDRVYSKLVKLDFNLNYVLHKNLPEDLYFCSIDTLDETRGMLYCISYIARKTLIINTDTFEYIDKKQSFAVYGLRPAGEKGEYLLFCYLSTLYVMDLDMNLISKHKLKGHIWRIETEGNRIFVITGTGDISCWGAKEDTCYARLYEICEA
ncbi:MAG: hypothetical protein FWF10_06415, partial [Clostridiales bacterium]|nr:hypothetical protein [Clostridiales bacterium]